MSPGMDSITGELLLYPFRESSGEHIKARAAQQTHIHIHTIIQYLRIEISIICSAFLGINLTKYNILRFIIREMRFSMTEWLNEQ